ncbi:MAG: thioredoxin family protein [Candidatus Eisenbacteria bacterium]|uniref:Thioredoxin family protein n=1 Tax=Eiseniibacteriota bacterium TaxID=2212470 RepID=A0A948W4P8_UNCEI|nr:thioredoxin family protein [Candidatus Eisenbacteria bacterium]MBU1949418.1 thioredoxin family protein [Candidatus Eisenbacteria bacterium]MBU2689574.1 thioredoxin family protein [Candidatus Eisenbacteria bacterium]
MIKKALIIAATILVFAAVFVLKETQRRDAASDAGHVLAPSEQVALPRLIDLGSGQCIPCKKMAPILEELSEEYEGSLIVEFIDIRKNPDAGQKWGIRVIPTQIFIDASGAERVRHEGFMAKQVILDQWKELGVELTSQTPQSKRSTDG